MSRTTLGNPSLLSLAVTILEALRVPNQGYDWGLTCRNWGSQNKVLGKNGLLKIPICNRYIIIMVAIFSIKFYLQLPPDLRDCFPDCGFFIFFGGNYLFCNFAKHFNVIASVNLAECCLQSEFLLQ